MASPTTSRASRAASGGADRVPTNTAAWLTATRGPLQVGPAPYTHPGEHEIVVRNHAVATNPLDWIKQVVGRPVLPWIRLPFVLGADVAGEVVEMGSAVTRFRTGDRVLGHAVGTDKNPNSSARGAFQSYAVLLERLSSPIPDDLSYQQAAVLPLGLSTAASGLFQSDHLGLRLPTGTSQPPPHAQPGSRAQLAGEAVLVWGGSTSVGSNAIQLAAAAGYDVLATASPRNHAYVTDLGASQAFDYRSSTAVSEIIRALAGRNLAGTIAIGAGSAQPSLDIVHATPGSKRLATASTAVSFEHLADSPRPNLQLIALLSRVLRTTTALQLRSRARGIRTTVIWGTTLKDNEVGPAIYDDFLPRALADHRYKAVPPAHVVGTGLDQIQPALDLHIMGVSASKPVVTLC